MSAEPTPTRKEQLLDVASFLFYEQGYHATGIKQIIEKAGIAKGTFFSHFASKEQIGVAWLRKRHAIWNGWLDAYLALQDPTPSGQIMGLFGFLERWMQDCKFRGCAFLNTLSELPDAESPMRLEIQSHKQDLLNRIELLARRLPSHDEASESLATARALLVLFEGCIVEMQVFREVWPVAVARSTAQKIIERR